MTTKLNESEKFLQIKGIPTDDNYYIPHKKVNTQKDFVKIISEA